MSKFEDLVEEGDLISLDEEGFPRVATPEGFRLVGIGGGFEAWIWWDKELSLEFRVFNLGWSSAPRTVAELNERTGVEVFVDVVVEAWPPMGGRRQTRFAMHGPEAVEYMESHGLTGGDNGESGALSWYFDTAAEAVAWVRGWKDRRRLD